MLLRNSQNGPFIKRLVTTWSDEQHAKLDVRILEAATMRLLAEKNALGAWEETIRARDNVARIHGTLKREHDLAEAEFETKMMEHQARQADLSPNPLRSELEEERLRADIAEQRARRAKFGEGDVEAQVRKAIHNLRHRSDFEARLADALLHFGADLSERERQRIAAMLRNEFGPS